MPCFLSKEQGFPREPCVARILCIFKETGGDALPPTMLPDTIKEEAEAVSSLAGEERDQDLDDDIIDFLDDDIENPELFQVISPLCF